MIFVAKKFTVIFKFKVLLVSFGRFHTKLPKPKISKPKIPKVQITQGQNTHGPIYPKPKYP